MGWIHGGRAGGGPGRGRGGAGGARGLGWSGQSWARLPGGRLRSDLALYPGWGWGCPGEVGRGEGFQGPFSKQIPNLSSVAKSCCGGKLLETPRAASYSVPKSI